MEVVINDAAKDHIHEKGKDNTITITMINVGSGWCPTVEPSVKMGKPVENSGFNMYDVNGIAVYLEEGIKSRRDKIEISMGKFLWRKHLNVDGISIM